jgi:hypothetical protein
MGQLRIYTLTPSNFLDQLICEQGHTEAEHP